MGKTERLLRLANLLRDRKKLRFDEMLGRLDVSPATLKRDLKYLREKLGTPVEYDAFERTYQIPDSPGRPRQELPGLWFTDADLQALLLAQRLLADLDPSTSLAPRLAAVVQRVEALLSQRQDTRHLSERIRVICPGRRPVDPALFASVIAALTRRRRLRVSHRPQPQPSAQLREISPVRIVHHRTWFLDAWCHAAQRLQRFALDAIDAAAVLEEPAQEVAMREVERLMDGGYGACPGEANHWAILVFSPQAAQAVAREVWHPMQRVRPLTDGRWELMLPYDDPADLVMDILRHGPDVEVVGSPQLRSAVAQRARALCALYG